MESIIYSPEPSPIDNLTVIKRLPKSGKHSTYYASFYGQIFAYNGKVMKVIKCTRKSFNPATVAHKGTAYKQLNAVQGSPLRHKFVHRLVAEVFCPNLNPLRNQVDHIDNNPANNRADNLRWCTQRENMRYAREIRTGERIITNLQKSLFYVNQ